MHNEIITGEQAENPGILAGSALVEAIEEQAVERRLQRAATSRMVERRLRELLCEVLNGYSEVLRPLGVQIGCKLSLTSDYTGDVRELYELLSRLRLEVAVATPEQRKQESSALADDSFSSSR